ncbi:serine hydrolase domain-containing protein [Streptomyces lichenis]|uniref:Beta-lactamase family protein n=1 Tax=Streptomyces lichenis TaxID=2306967 RepID=A0ABT0IAQ8_9ACTN|nr:serine hydrolase domain-containing protein [Streptomyces lichenis]MCK8678411.1 beta-lactamase family protein [Streptomyces lichenis]
MGGSRARRRGVYPGVALVAALALPASTGAAYAAQGPPGGLPVASAVLAAQPTPSADAFGSLTPEVAERLDAAVRRTMREAGIPGAVVSLSAPGKGEYLRAFGVADKATGAPMETGFHTRIGSETKTFTVTAILELADRGALSLDDPIAKYVEGVPNGGKITLRDLADMRSGLFNYTEDDAFGKQLMAHPREPLTPRQLLDYSFRHPVNFQPNAQFEYSNTNLILLGLVVEKAGGQPLHDFLRENVTGPAGLPDTFLPTGAEFPEPHAQGYTDGGGSTEENATDWNPSWAWAAGAMISTVRDLRSWARTVATGTLLEPETQAQRLVPRSKFDASIAYGMGIFLTNGWVGHNGSLPGYESVTMYLPKAQATMVVVLNTDDVSDGQEPSTLVASAVTRIVSPDHVYTVPTTPVAPSAKPSPSS